MRLQEIERLLNLGGGLFGFEYEGKDGYVDPCWNLQTEIPQIELFYNGTTRTAHSVEEALKTPFVCGKTLRQIGEDITVTEYVDWD